MVDILHSIDPLLFLALVMSIISVGSTKANTLKSSLRIILEIIGTIASFLVVIVLFIALELEKLLIGLKNISDYNTFTLIIGGILVLIFFIGLFLVFYVLMKKLFHRNDVKNKSAKSLVEDKSDIIENDKKPDDKKEKSDNKEEVGNNPYPLAESTKDKKTYNKEPNKKDSVKPDGKIEKKEIDKKEEIIKPDEIKKNENSKPIKINKEQNKEDKKVNVEEKRNIDKKENHIQKREISVSHSEQILQVTPKHTAETINNEKEIIEEKPVKLDSINLKEHFGESDPLKIADKILKRTR